MTSSGVSIGISGFKNFFNNSLSLKKRLLMTLQQSLCHSLKVTNYLRQRVKQQYSKKIRTQTGSSLFSLDVDEAEEVWLLLLLIGQFSHLAHMGFHQATIVQ